VNCFDVEPMFVGVVTVKGMSYARFAIP